MTYLHATKTTRSNGAPSHYATLSGLYCCAAPCGVLLEVASLTGYALVGIGREHGLFASFKYLIIGTIGASFYLIGIGYLYVMTGSLNMADLSTLGKHCIGLRPIIR